jgi:hypothetical protein
MNRRDETLTPRQRRIVVGSFVMICMAFSSVFAYAYVKGVLVREARASTQVAPLVQEDPVRGTRFSNLSRRYAESRAVRIVRGTTGPQNCQQSAALGTRFWMRRYLSSRCVLTLVRLVVGMFLC